MSLMVIVFGFVLLWAGIFGVISGIANGYIIKLRAMKKSTILRRAFILFFAIFFFHWIWTLVLGNSAVTKSPDDPKLSCSIVVALIYYGKFVTPKPAVYVFASALWMIASNVFLVSMLMYAMHGKKKASYYSVFFFLCL